LFWRCPGNLLQNPTSGEAFDNVYKKSAWGGDGVASSFSGGGSSVAATDILCKTLTPAILGAVQEKQEQSGAEGGVVLRILDAPSGDFFWMPH